MIYMALVAKWLMRFTCNEKVTGSNPVWGILSFYKMIIYNIVKDKWKN
jgi:hypothetical protein